MGRSGAALRGHKIAERRRSGGDSRDTKSCTPRTIELLGMTTGFLQVSSREVVTENLKYLPTPEKRYEDFSGCFGLESLKSELP